MINDSRFAFYDLAPGEENFRDAVLCGLDRARKAIPCKFFYDTRGSWLFEEICRLPEYYPTRTEIAILKEYSGDIAARIGPHGRLIEFGSGASQKVRILLRALDRPAAYVPVDISREHLRSAATGLAEDFPSVPVIAVCADYTRPFALPPLPGARGKRVGFFPGSTIGNFEPDAAVAFLANYANVLGPGGEMLIGVDLKKDPEILEAAYNDRAGVTAAFNLNLLERINRELDGDLDIDRFEHVAFYNPAEGRVEIYIRSQAEQFAQIAGKRFRFADGELIHTEYSYKYAAAEFRALAAHAGFRPVDTWTDAGELFSVHYFRLR
ncbi:MAG: L-histidine N(alpha)-methyltransferase [Alphaproteobacteria bacterium]|nr:L-histidine N(alpha)-methyltransferase [Alphaproteobacteria bacterium]